MKRIKRRISACLCALAISLSMMPGAALAADGMDSGSLGLPKLSQQQIVQLLSNNPLTLPNDIFDITPSCSAPYAPGKVSDSALQTAANRLSALRRIAGLPAVTVDAELSENAQYGAVLLSASSFSHTPDQPSDMDDSFYKRGYRATSSSNLASGYSLISAVDGFMEDSNASNVSRVGHRRWQLNPSMGKVGFGYSRGYTCEWAFDRSGESVDYDFVSWPASGNFPNTLFDGTTAWSVSLNPGIYATPNISDLTVTLTRNIDGKVWTFHGANYTPKSSGLYFTVESSGYGSGPCIIFRPDGITDYAGSYTVRINGLKTIAGRPVSNFTYQVDFFDPKSVTQHTSSTTSTAQTGTAYATRYSILVDGKIVAFDAYALKDANGFDTNYLKLRDVAHILDGTGSQFNVDFDPASGSILIATGTPYTTSNGSEMSTPFSGDRPYVQSSSSVLVDRINAGLAAITLTDVKGGGYTYFKLRDLGSALNFNVDWDAESSCVVITTQSGPRDPALSISPSSLSLTVGEQGTLVPTIKDTIDSPTIIYTSSDYSVAYADRDGKVTARKAGTADITASMTWRNKTYTATCTVTVKAAPVVTLSLSDNDLSLTVGETHVLTPSVTGVTSSPSITYRSSNSNVASVNSSGTITARKAGITVITASMTWNNKSYTSTCLVTVKEPTPTVSLSVNPTSLALTVGEKDTLIPIPNGISSTPTSFTFVSNNTAVATVNSVGTVIAKGAGTAVISIAMTYDGKVYATTCPVTVTENAQPQPPDPTEPDIPDNSDFSDGDMVLINGWRCTSLPADGRVTYYREEKNGNYMELEVVNGTTLRFSGCDSSPYINYAVLRVFRQHVDTPLSANVPFALSMQLDMDELRGIYGENLSGTTSFVVAMLCQNYRPGDINLAGYTFQSNSNVSLVIDNDGNCVIQVTRKN